jgi:S1-C subfamily serine protease
MAVVNMQALAGLRWVPAEDGRQISGKSYGGEKVYLDVLFKLNKLRFPAEVARISDRHDVALIKINSPQPVKSLNLLTDDSGIRVGQPVVVMGYPAISPTATVDVKSNDPFARRTRETIVPDTTVTPGSIGRILSEQARAADDPTSKILSGFGDTYQLTVNATGAGNSGGPVFDDRARVIGLFSAGSTDQQGTRLTFAVPIRYGIELMGTKPTGSAAAR